MVDWTSLPADILAIILQKLEVLKDYIVFGAVCKSWQHVILNSEEKMPSSPSTFPWLMLSEKRKRNPKRCFFSLASYKVYTLVLTEALGRKCLGAGFGWLLTLASDLTMNLLHPFLRYTISLPSQNTFLDTFGDDELGILEVFLTKAVLSSNPWKHDEDCIIMVIKGEYRELAFARLGDKRWTNVEVPSRVYEDIVYYKNQFYAVDCHGLVARCDLDNAGGPTARVIAPPPDNTREIDYFQKYLVESMGELLLVTRVRGGNHFGERGHKKRYYTASFEIRKLEKIVHDRERDAAAYEYCWVPMNDLGDRSLFLGFNASFSLSVKDCNGCFEANSIYFTDDNLETYLGMLGGGYDMGIFNMKDGTIKRHFQGSRSISRLSPPFWYM